MYLLHGRATREHSHLQLVSSCDGLWITLSANVAHFAHPMNLFNAETYARALATTTSSDDAVPENVR